MEATDKVADPVALGHVFDLMDDLSVRRHVRKERRILLLADAVELVAEGVLEVPGREMGFHVSLQL